MQQKLGLMHGLCYFFSSCANYAWLSSLAGESRASAGQATRGWGLPGTTCTDDFSMWHCSWVLESVIMAVRTQDSVSTLCVSVCKVERKQWQWSNVPLSWQWCHSIWAIIFQWTALRNRKNMGTGGLCLQQYNYCPGMADDLSSPAANLSQLIVHPTAGNTMSCICK